MTYVNWAWLALIILGILVLPYLLKRLNKYIKSATKSKKKPLHKDNKTLKKSS